MNWEGLTCPCALCHGRMWAVTLLYVYIYVPVLAPDVQPDARVSDEEDVRCTDVFGVWFVFSTAFAVLAAAPWSLLLGYCLGLRAKAYWLEPYKRLLVWVDLLSV